MIMFSTRIAGHHVIVKSYTTCCLRLRRATFGNSTELAQITPHQKLQYEIRLKNDLNNLWEHS